MVSTAYLQEIAFSFRQYNCIYYDVYIINTGIIRIYKAHHKPWTSERPILFAKVIQENQSIIDRLPGDLFLKTTFGAAAPKP